MRLLACFAISLVVCTFGWGQDRRGYYRFPTIKGNTIVFTAEGDLWRVGIEGGVARRLTTSLGEETLPAFSPDGKTLAFSANYEGPTEVYTMPAEGGLPTRRTFENGALVVGWTPDGKVLYATRRFSGLPDTQLATLTTDNRVKLIPLSQASQGVYEASGKTLFFTRLPFQGSHAKRYKGGTAQNIWKFTTGAEAVPLTADYPGTSKDAMWWKGRVYFLSDRDGTVNLWSMDENGRNLRQHTNHDEWDAKSAFLSDGRVVYQLGADLHLFDIASNTDKTLAVELTSDYEHLRERWVKQPVDYASPPRISYDGDRVILFSRGKIFLAPVKQGRFVESTGQNAARFRDAMMTPDGKSLITLSTQSGEVEVWKIPANGIGPGERLTTDGQVLRWEAIPSPDGKWVVHQDKNDQLWLLEIATKTQKKIGQAQSSGNSEPGFRSIHWSPDSRWLAWTTEAGNQFERAFLYSLDTGVATPLTTDRYNAFDPVWSTDGKWIYFLSDRALKSVVGNPWGPRAPDPYFDRPMKVYEVALKKGQRSPFEPADELHPSTPTPVSPKPDPAKPGTAPDTSNATVKPPKVEIDLDGLGARIAEIPVSPGNYRTLAVAGKRLCWLDTNNAEPDKTPLQCVDIDNKGEKPETLTDGVTRFEISGDGKKMLLVKKNDLFVYDTTVKEAALKVPKTVTDAQVNLKDWTFSVVPSDEFHELFLEAWRLHRDYFYDPKMHGVNWTAVKEKYLTLTMRVRDRQELSDLIAQMVSELSALHTFVRGGDLRKSNDQIELSTLGADLERSDRDGGYVVKKIYRHDPDRPDLASPLARANVGIVEGDVVVAVNGRDSLSAVALGELLRNRAGKQVALRVKSKTEPEGRDVIVKPLTMTEDAALRYHAWEYSRRLAVEKQSEGQIGYVHLRAMGPNDIAQWAEQFYPVFDKSGLIIDVRHNGGGNIDSWLLGKLLRKAWFFWQPRVGKPYWNMQYAFRGHIVVLCDERTASDGEAFAEGFRRLGLGKIIGRRTWGGEIWLSGSNNLPDNGIATAAEYGVYADGKWLIEGHGVAPDIAVDNLPHATFNGEDAQLRTAIETLKKQIQVDPVTIPQPPKYPNLSKQSTERRSAGN